LNVIQHYSEEFKLPITQGGRRSLFLVNTVALGDQVADEIRKNLNVKVSFWSSETSKKTSWTKERFQKELNDHHVLISTVQLFVDAVKHSFINIGQFNVMIFDECHHGRMNHPYHELMKQFKYIEPSRTPRIIGLSAQLIGISSKITVETVEYELKTLESTFLSTIVTVNSFGDYKNVLLYSTKPNEGFIKYIVDKPDPLIVEIKNKIEKIRWDLSLIKIKSDISIDPQTLRQTAPKKLKEFSLLFEDVKFALEDMGIYGGYLCTQSIRVQFELIKKNSKLNRQFEDVLDQCMKHVDCLEEMFKEADDFSSLTIEMIVRNSSSKVKSLIGILKTKFLSKMGDENFQSLVFVSRRCIAKCLYHLLKQFAELDVNLHIIPDFIVGINGIIPESISEVENTNNNKFAIDRFRRKQTNVVCASSVLEEGMDLQSCNLVVMFDYPTTFRAYIQSKGRARSKDSDYIVLISSGKADIFLSKRNLYDEIDKKMKRVLIGKTCDRQLSQEEIDKEREEEWEPFITEKKALVNNISSIALLNRYVSRYGNTNKLFERRDYGPGRIKALLKLPPKCGIKQTIESDFFNDIKLAKQNVAFKAIEILHKHNALDEHLMPIYSQDDRN
jgi:endoribonuclease Dicer